VITGFLGAGKTSLINGILRDPSNLRIVVLVNDFGELAVDHELIKARDENVLMLANGCICCSMADGFYATLVSVLERQPRPDHLVIEASGVADPSRIASIAVAEPDMTHDATIAVVDGRAFLCQIEDPLIGDSILRQLRHADLIAVNKIDVATEQVIEEVRAVLNREFPSARLTQTAFGRLPPDVVLGGIPKSATAPVGADDTQHEGQFERWTFKRDAIFDLNGLRRFLNELPPGVLRLKGAVRCDSDATWAMVQAVGARSEVKMLSAPPAWAPMSLLTAIAIAGTVQSCSLDKAVSAVIVTPERAA